MIRRSSGIFTHPEESPKNKQTDKSDTASEAPTVVIDWSDTDGEREAVNLDKLAIATQTDDVEPATLSEEEIALLDTSSDEVDEMTEREYSFPHQSIAELKEQLKIERELKAAAYDRIEDLEKSLADWHEKIIIAHQSLDAREKQVEKLEVTIQNLMTVNRNMASKLCELTAKNASFRAEQDKLREMIVDQQSELVDHNREQRQASSPKLFSRTTATQLHEEVPVKCHRDRSWGNR